MADINHLKNTWDQLGKYNAFWAVLSDKKQWDEKEFFETGRKEIKHVLGVLKAESVTLKYDRALDFGCGVGRLSQALGKHFKEVVGIDIAGSMVEQADRLNKRRNVSFKHITSGNLKAFRNNSFDFVFTDIVFQHMSNQLTLGYLEEMYRVLKKQGVLVFQLPSKPAITWKGMLIKGLPNSVLTRMRKGMEMNPIPKAKVLQHLEKIGFEVVTVKRDANHKHWHAYFYYVRKPKDA